MPRPRRRRQEPRQESGGQTPPQGEPQARPQPDGQAGTRPETPARPAAKPQAKPRHRSGPRPQRDHQAAAQPAPQGEGEPKAPRQQQPKQQRKGQPKPPRDHQAKGSREGQPKAQPAPQREGQPKPPREGQPKAQPAPQREGQSRARPRPRPQSRSQREGSGKGQGEPQTRGQGEPQTRGQGDRRPARPDRRGDRRPERRYAPRLPADGIKAKAQRGEFGESWWARRWIAVLEGFGYGGRLARGRTYARDGAVLSMEFGRGQVSARVQGSRPSPYTVRINVPPLSDEQWARAIEAMAEQAIFAAKLLAGEMPLEIEEAFAAAQVPLFPRSARDLTTSCSCPDPANPCKHIAAVYYLLGERFDSDPFLLFELRGRSKEQIGDALRALRAEGVAEEEAPAPEVERAPALAELLASFDDPGDLDEITPQIAPPELDAPLLRRYGAPPAATGEDLTTVYRTLSRLALDRLLGGE